MIPITVFSAVDTTIPLQFPYTHKYPQNTIFSDNKYWVEVLSVETFFNALISPLIADVSNLHGSLASIIRTSAGTLSPSLIITISPGTNDVESILTQFLFRRTVAYLRKKTTRSCKARIHKQVRKSYSGMHSLYSNIAFVLSKQGKRQHSHAGALRGGGTLLYPTRALISLEILERRPSGLEESSEYSWLKGMQF